MRRKLQLMFIFMCLGALAGYGQGIGDRNRPGESDGSYTIKVRVYMPDGRPRRTLKSTSITRWSEVVLYEVGRDIPDRQH
jgi:hypothetical protein